MSAMDRVVRIMQGITAVVTAAFIILLFTNEPQQPQIVPGGKRVGRGADLQDALRVVSQRRRQRRLRPCSHRHRRSLSECR
jgi:hypothetical protein